MSKSRIEFKASLPPIRSAIIGITDNIYGQENGARIKLDIPANEIVQIMELQSLTGKRLEVTIEYGDERIIAQMKRTKRTKNRQKGR